MKTNVSVNRVEVTGNLCCDARVSENKNFAGFDLAHNCGKGRETLFDKVQMSNKNGSKAIEIPFDILTKGNRVLVKGYRVKVKKEYTDKDGNTRTDENVYIRALSVEAWPYDEQHPSINKVEISGNLCADARKSESGNFAGFDIAHNAGKKNPVLFDAVKMFAREGDHPVVIPADILTKGKRVLVEGFRRSETETFKGKDGEEKTYTRTVIIATKVADYPWSENDGEDVPAAEEEAGDLPIA